MIQLQIACEGAAGGRNWRDLRTETDQRFVSLEGIGTWNYPLLMPCGKCSFDKEIIKAVYADNKAAKMQFSSVLSRSGC